MIKNIISILVIIFNSIIIYPQTSLAKTCSADNWCLESPSPLLQSFYGVWGTSSSNVYIVGVDGITHYDGATWTTGSPINYWGAIWGSAENDIYVVSKGGAVYHFNGTDWVYVSVGGTNARYGIWGTSSSDIYIAATAGALRHYNGSYWKYIGVEHHLSYNTAIWGSGTTDVYVLNQNNPLSPSSTIIKHWDGSRDNYGDILWSTVSTGLILSGRLNAIWGSSDKDVYAVGDNGTILHFGGNSWSSMTTGITENLNAIWGSSDKDVYAVGDNGTILHFDGTSWSNMDSGTSATLYGVWGSSSSDVFAIGSSGVILRRNFNDPSKAPSISNVNPNPVIGFNAPQLFSIEGNNFQPDSNITLRDLRTGQTYPNRIIISFSSSKIEINPNFTNNKANWTVEVINSNGKSSGQYPFIISSLKINSPVIGPFRVTHLENINCSNLEGLWTFCQHQSAYHRPGGGISGSDDTFAWDLNLLSNKDYNKSVFAVAPGKVVKYANMYQPGERSGSVLIEHVENGIKWWSGYLHMSNVLIKEGDQVSTSDELGKVDNVCDGCDGVTITEHLHFVVYEGSNTAGGLLSRDAEFDKRTTLFPWTMFLPVILGQN